MQYRKGTYTNSGSPTAQTITLGFIPDHFIVTSYTSYGSNSAITRAEWYNGMPNASALLQTTNGSAIPVQSLVSTNGFTPFSNGAQYSNTQLTITGVSKANPGVVTLSSIGSLVNGDTVTISSVVGMIQLNQNRYIVGGISGSTFKLYDFFGNPIDTTGFGTYVSGGQVNIISNPATAPTVNAQGVITSPGQPAGLQYDTGSMGMTVGTSVVGNANDVMYWEAFFNSVANQ